MAAERRPGSDRGRPSVDWEAAFGFYAALPDPERSYHAVADQFQVSVRTVEKHGRDEQWKKRLAAVKREAALALNEQLADRHLDSLQDALKLADATYARYAQQLQAGAVKVSPSDIARMHALRTQITDTIQAHTTNQANDNQEEARRDIDAEQAHQLAVLKALQSSGALDRILALLTPPNHNPETEE